MPEPAGETAHVRTGSSLAVAARPPCDLAAGRLVYDPATDTWSCWRRSAAAPDGFRPMRAREYIAARQTFPVLAQAKIDGVRAILSASGLASRGGGEILSLPELAALSSDLPAGVHLDGELAIDGEPLEVVAAIVATATPHPRRGEVRFHVFDVFEAGAPERPFVKRAAEAAQLAAGLMSQRVTVVETAPIATVEALDRHYAAQLAVGREGQIIRDPAAPYVQGKTSALLRRKPFRDAEAELIRIVAGERSGLPHSLIARDCDTGEVLTVAIQAMSDADRAALAASLPEAGRLITYRWQESGSAIRRHCTLVTIHGPAGRF